MSTSEFGYLIDTDPTYVAAANQPLDNISARAVLNNAMHLSDEFAQVRVAWSDSAGLAVTSTAPFTNLPVISFQFPLTLRQNGDAYKLRVRFAGSVAAGTTTFRAVVGPPGPVGALRSWGGAGDREFVTASLGAANAWLTGSSQGSAASPDLLTLPSAIVTTQSFQTKLSLGGVTTTVNVPFAQLTVYCTATASAPVLAAVYCAEYVGV